MTMQVVNIFQSMSAEEVGLIGKYSRLVTYRNAEPVLLEDEPGNQMFVIKSGTVKVYVGTIWVVDLGPGDVFGEVSLIDNGTRTASIFASGSVELLAMNAGEVDLIAEAKKEVAIKLIANLAKILSKKLIMVDDFIMKQTGYDLKTKFSEVMLDVGQKRDTSLFTGLSNHMMEWLRQYFTTAEYQQGENIVQEGDFGSELFQIVLGQADVLIDERKVAGLKDNDIFGEISFLLGTSRTATIRAMSDVHVNKISSAKFNSLSKDFPFIGYRIYVNLCKLLAGKLRLADNVIRQSMDNIVYLDVKKSLGV
ncbi:hypothetical protein A2533_03250 [Candidatus Falkowbacteria bacterium RIFOXYD2_FULL_35_9]|uniref:Cyclic nucleotide-binding domain-containing protein n=1 Tax=Candidatus Falkowbacteria bacterium RIFOXYC2_FULL_36_12 TaxID=1798002 RepID=A0A1F5SVU9_9BACT|nr:MAG: hypothetical protein A2300_00720 [Candidatus Falkowbacteria bacterium RIFOXYB2_FULL_35_7]OGF30865.1 MAG: hypothetical protein A2478_00215 [Candidatus Falkowbacteria bacterium RIFOXYC2_FULL_36_12]OGF34244.1 MAG: hypothetical protein A2223_04575 [Candidatus Falkowbacteria bacterium RIFOXYA2_FULL_35_8]OGF48223.1 MAG: hypothetical protein A2533_03250 [Candidatus Falkowbacteria bacterium RIFOXYD2_FULL_35_9]